jgi:hypothetical protein
MAAGRRPTPVRPASRSRLTSQNRYAIRYRIGSAKRVSTRARRIEQFVAMLARGETIYPQQQKLGPDREVVSAYSP